MFPQPWVRNFTNSGQNPSTLTIATLLAYMNEQHSAKVSNNEHKHGFDNGGGQNGHTKCIHSGRNNHHYQQRGGRGHNNNYNNNNGWNHFHRGGNGGGCGNGNSRGSLPPISQMMNAVSMVDTNGGSVISTLGEILMLHYMETVEEVVVITELQDSSITMLSQMVKTILPMPECKGLHFMAEHLEGMLVCMVLKVHNPTRLADLFCID
jgi:hypothetical protein